MVAIHNSLASYHKKGILSLFINKIILLMIFTESLLPVRQLINCLVQYMRNRFMLFGITATVNDLPL